MNCIDAPSPVADKQPWHEVNWGLRQVVTGYVAMCLFGLISLAAFALASQPATAARLGLREPELLHLLGVLTGGIAGLAYFAALLLGQWRCLKFTPSDGGSRECLFACIVFLGLALLIGLCYVASLNNLFHDPAKFRVGRQEISMINAGLVAGVVGLLLLNFLVFNHCLQILRGCFNDRPPTRNVDPFFLFASLLIGGTIGLFMHWVHLSYRGLASSSLVLAWVGCFAWHLTRIAALRRRIAKRLESDAENTLQAAELYVPKKLSGVRRALRF